MLSRHRRRARDVSARMRERHFHPCIELGTEQGRYHWGFAYAGSLHATTRPAVAAGRRRRGRTPAHAMWFVTLTDRQIYASMRRPGAANGHFGVDLMDGKMVGTRGKDPSRQLL